MPPTTLAAPAVPLVSARTKATALVLVGILLVALNLRAAITSLGALLPEVRAGLGLSPTMAGLLTTIPALSFAAFGAATPWLTRRFTHAQVLVGAMTILALGQLTRVFTDSAVIFLITSAAALAGIAVANVLLPVVVRKHFADRATVITGVYTMTLIAGTTTAAAASVPIAHAFGDWRAGLGVWAVLAAVAALPWLLAPGTRAREANPVRLKVGRTRLGWAMALYFGLQSLSGYATMGWLAQLFRDSGFTAESAGLLLAGVTTFGLPIAFLVPALAGRRANPRVLILVMSGAMIASYLGLAFSPHNGAVLWVALLALGQGAFPLALAMIGMRARTPGGIVALSAFSQSVGYLIAALGPLVVGIIYGLTGGWTVPLGFLIAAALIQVVAGLAVARPRYVEDEL